MCAGEAWGAHPLDNAVLEVAGDSFVCQVVGYLRAARPLARRSQRAARAGGGGGARGVRLTCCLIWLFWRWLCRTDSTAVST